MELLVLKQYKKHTQLVGFYLSLPMEFIYSAPFFCTTMDTVAYLFNTPIHTQDNVLTHHLKDKTATRSPRNYGPPTYVIDTD